MSNENINNKKRVWSQIDIENPSQFSNHEESLDIQRKTENAFDKLNKEKSGDSGPSNVQNKGKGGSKLRSWYIIGVNKKLIQPIQTNIFLSVIKNMIMVNIVLLKLKYRVQLVILLVI